MIHARSECVIRQCMCFFHSLLAEYKALSARLRIGDGLNVENGKPCHLRPFRNLVFSIQ